MPLDIGGFLESRSSLLPELFLGHLLLTLAAVGIAVVIAVTLGLLCYDKPVVSQVSLLSTGAILTIPSFALLGILVTTPLGFGTNAVLVALVAYGLLPILRNTTVGLQGVDRNLVEAARGMGMSRLAVLRRVELPLAWPVILGGVRVTTQLVIGIAAIGAYVNGPGWGEFIFSGLARIGAVFSRESVIVGTVGVVLTALVLDLALLALGRATTSKGIRA